MQRSNQAGEKKKGFTQRESLKQLLNLPNAKTIIYIYSPMLAVLLVPFTVIVTSLSQVPSP